MVISLSKVAQGTHMTLRCSVNADPQSPTAILKHVWPSELFSPVSEHIYGIPGLGHPANCIITAEPA